jgi:hypothetical protein
MAYLLDFRRNSTTPVAGHQLVKETLVGTSHGWDRLEEEAERCFEENRRYFEAHDVVPSYLFDSRSFWTCCIIRSCYVASGRGRGLDFLVPNEQPDAARGERAFRLFDRGRVLPEGLTVFNLSGEHLELEGVRVAEWNLPPLVHDLRLEPYCWAIMEQMLEEVNRRKLGPYAAYFGQETFEASALLRTSRKLNEGHLSRVFIRDGLGGVREMRVVNRWDPRERERLFGNARD